MRPRPLHRPTRTTAAQNRPAACVPRGSAADRARLSDRAGRGVPPAGATALLAPSRLEIYRAASASFCRRTPPRQNSPDAASICLRHNTGQMLSNPGPETVLFQRIPKRSEIAEIKSGMGAIRSALDRQLAAAEEARAALKQPDDLKPVYTVAYDRDVTQPAKAFAEIFPDVDAAIGAILAFIDYLDQNRDQVKIEGAMIQVGNPSVQARLQALIEAMHAKQQAIQDAQQHLRSLAQGT